MSLYVQSLLPCKNLLGSIPNPLTVQHPPGAALLLYNKAPRPRQRASEGFSCCLWILSLLWLYPCSDSPAAAVTLHSRGSSQQ
nr:MAG TPA: hypothetical protein [Caudoviricetes sp.]